LSLNAAFVYLFRPFKSVTEPELRPYTNHCQESPRLVSEIILSTPCHTIWVSPRRDLRPVNSGELSLKKMYQANLGTSINLEVKKMILVGSHLTEEDEYQSGQIEAIGAWKIMPSSSTINLVTGNLSEFRTASITQRHRKSMHIT
jgi:hypothetical protein